MSDEQKDDPAATMQHKVVAKIMPLGEPEPPRPSAGPDVSAFDAVPARGVDCPHCGGQMEDCDLLDRLLFAPKERNLKLVEFRPVSPVAAWVCTNCGYAEMYATNPHNLLPGI